MSQPILSIISPVFNGERYLRTFIQAVIDQHCPQVEHIIIDGGSRDNSVKIIEEFARQYPHIRWLSEKDYGSAEAVNKGIALARGTFITLLCLNDFYEPGTLNEVIALLPALPQPAFLVGNCNILNDKNELLSVNKPEALTPLKIMMKKQFPYNPSAYFYHKGLHEKIGLYHNVASFDLDFLIRVFRVAKVHYVDKCWGNFRMLPDSITVKAQRAGTLDAGEYEIHARYLKTYPALHRVFFRMVVALNKRQPRLVYFLDRILHYIRDPKDILRFLGKKPGDKKERTSAEGFYNGFFIDKPVGNNAFSFAQRKNKKIYVAPLVEGTVDDIREGREIVFSEVSEGKEVNKTGLNNFVQLSIDGRQVFIFDNHNHAFFFWMYAFKQGLMKPGMKLVHVDQHKDTREPEKFLTKDLSAVTLKESFAYTNFELNVGNFIPPAVKLKMFADVIMVDSKESLAQTFPEEFILDLDMDIFSKDMQYIDYNFKFNTIRGLLKKARLTTIATSPYFIGQAEAIRILKELLA